MVAFFSTYPLLGKILLIVLFFVLAWILHLLARRLSRRIVRFNLLTPKTHRPRPERQETMQGLVASVISSIGFFLAILASVGQFVQLDTLVWAVTLFSTAFGFGARAYISDLLAGVGFLFEDAFAVGEKVDILGVEGVVEAVRIRTTLIRAPSGELFIMPNGEIRVVRNFSRGRFSTATIRLKIRTGDLVQALPVLESLGEEAVSLLPNLLEPWQILSEKGEMGQQTELTVLAKARFGKAAAMRPQLLTLVEKRLSDSGVALVD